MPLGLPRVAAGAALGVALLAAGCGSSPPSEAGEDGGARVEVRQLVREQGRALAAGDVDAYLAPVADEARDTLATFAQGVVAAPIERLDMRLGEADVDAAADVVSQASVEVVFAYEDVADDNPFRAELTVDFARRDGDWTVTASELVEPAPIWATGDVEATRSEHFWVLSRPGVGDHDAIAELLEDIRQRLVGELDVAIDPVHVVVLADGDDAFAELVGPDLPASATAVAMWQFTTDGMAAQARAQHRQMVVNLDPAGGGVTVDHHGAADIRPREVFAHELAHLVLHRFTSPSTPGWLVEAGAMYLAGERRSGLWQSGVARDAFADRSIAELDEGLDPVDYAYANAAGWYLVEQEGAATLWELYRSVGGGDGADGVDGVDRALGHLYGFDQGELDRRVRDWIQEAVADRTPQ